MGSGHHSLHPPSQKVLKKYYLAHPERFPGRAKEEDQKIHTDERPRHLAQLGHELSERNKQIAQLKYELADTKAQVAWHRSCAEDLEAQIEEGLPAPLVFLIGFAVGGLLIGGGVFYAGWLI